MPGSSRSHRQAFLTIAAAVCCIGAAAAEKRVLGTQPVDDVRIGRWRLVQMKVGSQPQPPTSSVWTYAIDGSELRVDAHVIGPAGRALHWSFRTKLDGTESRVRGNPTVDQAVMTRRDDQVLEVVYKKAGVVIAAGTNEVSPDGRTMTVTLTNTVGTVTIGV